MPTPPASAGLELASTGRMSSPAISGWLGNGYHLTLQALPCLGVLGNSVLRPPAASRSSHCFSGHLSFLDALLAPPAPKPHHQGQTS